MSLQHIVAGDYGYNLQLTVIDVDTDAAADVSTYTTAQTIILEDPNGSTSDLSASFATDGSDGVVEYTVQDGDIDTAGNWKARVRLTSGSARLTTAWASFRVYS